LTIQGANFEYALCRYSANGILDTTFGTAGIVHGLYGTSSDPRTIAEQSDGKIIIAGSQNSDRMFFARFTSEGVLDTSFGSAGYLTLNPSPSPDDVRTILFDSNGYLLFGGNVDQYFSIGRIK
jgi:uncharacterized delta-60 repeat protein